MPAFDPIMLKYVDIIDWISMDVNHVIFYTDIDIIASNKTYYKNIPDNNLLVNLIFEGNNINYKKTIRSNKYINLSKYGIDIVIDYDYFIACLKVNKQEYKFKKHNTIQAINYEYLLHNPKAYRTIDNYGYIEEQYSSLKNYTFRWDRAINKYLRSNISDDDYINDEEFLKYYKEFGDTPEDALINIKEAIKNIDEAFVNSLVSEEEFVLYRGTEDCFLYDGMNLGFISTSISYNAAFNFTQNKGCVYEMHIGTGIPYIYMEPLTKVTGEEEILLPRNLVTILRERKGRRYIVDVVLSRDDQFIFDKEYKEYHSYIIEGFTYIKTSLTSCYKNKIIDGNIIDPITNKIITNSINNNGMCYNKSTIVNIIDQTKNGLYLDPFTRIPFSEDIMMQVLYLLLNKNNILITMIRGGYFNIVKSLIDDGADVNYLNGIALITACEYNHEDIVELLIDNGVNVNSRNGSPLINACINGNLNLVKHLIEKGAIINLQDNEAIVAASTNGFLDIVKLLVENGADVNSHDGLVLINASRNGFLDIVEYLIERDADATLQENKAAIEAFINNHLDIVKLLIDNGANIDSRLLLDATKNDKFETVKSLIDKGIDINIKNGLALINASYEGNLKIVKLLVENGADINSQGGKALIDASENGFPDIIEYLIEKGADINSQGGRPLVVATRSDDFDIVKLLIDNGADVNLSEGQPLIDASKNNNLDIVNLLIKNNAKVNLQKSEALIEAIRNDNIYIIEILIKNGINVNARMGEPLTTAIREGNINIVKLLVENGANINLLMGRTALILALKYNHINIAKYLIEKGINFKSYGDEALIIASEKGYIDIVKLLIDNGVDVNSREGEALIKASENGHINIVKLLIDNGADVGLQNNRALTMASKNNHQDIVKLLRHK